MKKLPVSVLFLGYVCSIAAQTLTDVRGHVRDADDLRPVAGALVKLMATGRGDSSKADGSFRISAAAVRMPGRGNARPELTFDNGMLRFDLAKTRRVWAGFAGLDGRIRGPVFDGPMTAGAHALSLSSDRRQADAAVLVVKLDDRVQYRKTIRIGRQPTVSQHGAAVDNSELAKSGATFDTLLVMRKGYVTRKLPVATYADSIEVLLVWRPFSDSSPWNGRIPASQPVDDSSAAMIRDLVVSSQWNFLGINIAGYSIPVYAVDSATTPKYHVTCTDVTGQWFDRPVPICDSAAPDPQSDRHLCIVDKNLGREWGMWNTVKLPAGGWQCGVGAASDLNGTGVRPASGQANPWQLAMGARASGFPLVAGLIRVGEIRAGRIDHALAIAYPHCRSRYFVPPASTAQGTNGVGAQQDRGIPMGGRVQLDPAIDVDTLPISATGKVIARALQEYGAYVCDYSGAINLYADGSPAAQRAWSNGLLGTYEISTVFNAAMLGRFRVCKLPAFLDNHN